MIKKLRTIGGFAVFKNFDWNTTVRDKGNNIAEFKKLNILYGRNYSGKTTLSRIFRSFEKGEKHEKYTSAKYEIEHSGKEKLNHDNFVGCPYSIRVYNKDFVDENLRWLTDSEGSIKPFAILGEKNVEIEKKIEALEQVLGSSEEKHGLRYEYENKALEHQLFLKTLNSKNLSLQSKLRKKANEDIKRNPIYNVVTYNINSILNDIKTINLQNFKSLNQEEIDAFKGLLKEKPKENISAKAEFQPQFSIIYENYKFFLEKEITPTESINELINNYLLQEWVRSGIDHHRDKRTSCAFCGSLLKDKIWKKLDAHFSKESEELRAEIKLHIALIEKEKLRSKEIIVVNFDQFYSSFHPDLKAVKKELTDAVAEYCSILDVLINDLSNREEDIFTKKEAKILIENTEYIKKFELALNQLIVENNNKTITLTEDQKSAREKLRLGEIRKFLKDIDYVAEQKNLDTSSQNEIDAKKKKDELKDKIDKLEEDIGTFKIKLKDERKGADKVNEYLNHYFGHNGLKLVAVEKPEGDGFNFKVMRGEEEAHNLSEGECSLVAFCYFVAKLDDIETKDTELIIWVDDPISSLDSNHVFFVFSLIESVIAKPFKKEDGSNGYKYSQLFVSTHNLEFLKYLKRLSRPKKDTEFFLIERGCKESLIRLMPNYLKDYITEFNYLFHQIYKCKSTDHASAEHNCFYNFGNNLRKFLEAYLYYKYPTNKSITEKLKLFFKDDQLAVDLTNRLDNELSHLEEIFDRSMTPIEIPEIPKLANYVLDKIKNKDLEQYESLLESIGVNE